MKTFFAVIIVFVFGCVIGAGGMMWYVNLKINQLNKSTNNINEKTVEPEDKVKMTIYKSKEWGFEFEYPEYLYLKEGPLGDIILVENIPANVNLVEEKLVSFDETVAHIKIDSLLNDKKLSSEAIARSQSSWKISDKSVEEIEFKGFGGVEYAWNGVYEGKTKVVRRDNKIHIFSGSWLKASDQIARDFEMILGNIRFI